MPITDIRAVVPSRLQVGEPFTLKLKVFGPLAPVPSAGGWLTPKPGHRTPYNLNVERQIQFQDNSLPGFRGAIRLADDGLEAPAAVVFDGHDCGIYANDDRPIKQVGGCRFTKPGFHFIRLIDEASGLEGWSNPVWVTPDRPEWRLVWGDPHCHTFFTDGIRCPEDIYHFARYEGCLDFCALTDHSEGLSDAQWLYFQTVTNAANSPGAFATLIGQEWTHHLKPTAPGHRNIYVRTDQMPIVRCTDPATDTLDKLWSTLDTWPAPVLALPHHSANVVMGTDWGNPWHPGYEKAVEIYSVWGNSERPEAAGNPMPIRSCQGEMNGRHVQVALAQGRRFSFIGGGDIHDGRPGDAQHQASYPPGTGSLYRQGFTAARVSQLTREAVFDAIADGHTYATTASRIYLDAVPGSSPRQLSLLAASEDRIARIELVCNGDDATVVESDERVVEVPLDLPELGPDDYCYVRLTTREGNLAWWRPRP